MITVDKREYLPERHYAALSRGEALRMTRELKGLTQAELAAVSGISQAAISSIETGRIDIGLDRAEKLARPLGVHPAVLAFPNWRQRESGVVTPRSKRPMTQAVRLMRDRDRAKGSRSTRGEFSRGAARAK